MKKLFSLVAIAISALTLSAQTINDPNAEVRNVKGFHAIQVSNAIDLYLSQSNDEAVAVSASEIKYRDKIRTEVENGVLKIYLEKDSWKFFGNGNKKLKAYVSFKTLDELRASGASDVQVTGVIKSDNLKMGLSGASDFKGAVEVNSLEIDQSGASDAQISGSAKTVNAEASGASQLKGYDLTTENCSARASGASDIKITCNKELSAHASGASGIYYKGTAVIKDVHSSGASSVSKRS
jgi:hypothetical protein